jgi:GDP-4-dehydro-6-deoxy-D-mannose reductase
MVGKILITGGSGFVGRYVIAEGLKRGSNLTALGRGPRPGWLESKVNWISADLTSGADVSKIPRQWSAVIHLAANSVPSKYVDANSIAQELELTTRLTEHLKPCRFLYVSSCHVYGSSIERHVEDELLCPNGRYGSAKMLCEAAVLSAKQLDVVIARPFNHVGRGMPQDLVMPTIVSRLLAATPKSGIDLTGTNSLRDFLDVRDIVRAYFDLISINKSEKKIFNVCRGTANTVEQMALEILKNMGRSEEIRFTGNKLSGDDVDSIIGNNDLIMRKTNWRPHISFEESICDYMRNLS